MCLWECKRLLKTCEAMPQTFWGEPFDWWPFSAWVPYWSTFYHEQEKVLESQTSTNILFEWNKNYHVEVESYTINDANV